MNVVAPFGFVTGCHAGDKFMVQATLASMRHYCPQVPICLVVDGEFDVSDLEKQYDLIVLRIPELPLAEMKKLIGGNYRAKLAAMWEGPFEFYVWLDSDAIVWGDFTSLVRTDIDFQIFWSEISIPANATKVPAWLIHYYFNLDKLLQIDDDFEWRGHAYFSAGAFGCRRNVFSYQEWVRVDSLNNKFCNGLFKFGDMGILNYLVHEGAQHGRIKTAIADLQHIWRHHGTAEFIQDCDGSGWNFPKYIKRPRIAHFCGRKPFLIDRKSYSRPFTIARLEHHRRTNSETGAWLAVLIEEHKVLLSKIRRKIKS